MFFWKLLPGHANFLGWVGLRNLQTRTTITDTFDCQRQSVIGRDEKGFITKKEVPLDLFSTTKLKTCCGFVHFPFRLLNWWCSLSTDFFRRVFDCGRVGASAKSRLSLNLRSAECGGRNTVDWRRKVIVSRENGHFSRAAAVSQPLCLGRRHFGTKISSRKWGRVVNSLYTYFWLIHDLTCLYSHT